MDQLIQATAYVQAHWLCFAIAAAGVFVLWYALGIALGNHAAIIASEIDDASRQLTRAILAHRDALMEAEAQRRKDWCQETHYNMPVHSNAN